MGSSGLNQIRHARRGIPWLGVAAVAAPAITMLVCSFIWYRSGPSWGLLRWGLLTWAVTSAFLLDEPAQAVVSSTARSPWWWHGARFIGAIPLVALPVLVTNLWAMDRPPGEPDPAIRGLLIQSLIAMLLVLSAAAVAKRLGHDAPGDVVASSAVLFFLLILIIPFSFGGIPLLPWAGDPRWESSIEMWLIFGAFGLVTLIVSIVWRPRTKRVHANS